MKIGILTFHWAANYGAILQAYALQMYLQDAGHSVDIINYKPIDYDFCVRRFLNAPGLIKSFWILYKENQKNIKLETFRKNYLNQTERIYSEDELNSILEAYDVLISGSDQVLNPGFTLNGEGKPTSVYYLNFPNISAKKIGYALSFGCMEYPANAKKYAKKWILNFDYLSVRENTGINIVKGLTNEKTCYVVPDPTILYGRNLFNNIKIPANHEPYILKYMLHGREISVKADFNVKSINSMVSMENWLSLIKHSKGVITNSYHGMIVSCLFHVPFVVLLEQSSLSGMNDRFNTLLNKIGLENRIVDASSSDLASVLSQQIDWKNVDEFLEDYRQLGVKFLEMI